MRETQFRASADKVIGLINSEDYDFNVYYVDI